MSEHIHTPERFTPTTGHGEEIPGIFHRCSDCGELMYIMSHPSICRHCSHAVAVHDEGQCWASVREAPDSLARCQCPGTP